MHIFNSPLSAIVRAGAVTFVLSVFFAGLAHASWQPAQPNTVGTDNGVYGKYWTKEHINTFVKLADTETDSAGNIYILGSVDDGVSGTQDILVSRVDQEGVILWQATYDSGQMDRAVSLALDQDNNVIVGLVSNVTHNYVGASTITDKNRDYVVIKFLYDPANDTYATIPEWVATYDSLTPTSSCLNYTTGSKLRDCGQDDLVAMAVDGVGDIYLTGTSNDGSVSQFNNISTVKISGATGAIANALWRTNGLYDNGAHDHPIGIAVDSSGTVLVTGTSLKVIGNNPADKDIVVIRHNGTDGSLLTTPPYRYDSGLNDAAFTQVLNPADNSLYVAGETMNGIAVAGINDVLLLKLDSLGNLLWTTRYASDAKKAGDAKGGHDTARTIDVDNSGNVYVGAKVKGIANYDLAIIKFSSSGGLPIWASTPIDYGDDDAPLKIVLAQNGDLFVAARVGDINNYDSGFLRYDSASGALLSSTIENGSASDNNVSLSLFTGIEGVPGAIVVNDSDQTSQQAIQVKKFDIARPDLTAIAATAPPIGVYRQDVDLTVTLRNIQDSFLGKIAHAGAFIVGYYLDDGVNPPILIGEQPVAGLNSGVDATYGSVFTIQPTIPVGFYTLNAVVDHTSLVTERDRTNNTFSIRTIEIINPPDLDAVSVSGTPSLPAATPLDITYSYSNITEVTAVAPFDIQFLLSTDGVLSADDLVLGTVTRTTDFLGNSSVTDATVTFTVPHDTPAGFYTIIMDIVPDRSMIEAFYNNNTEVSQNQIEVLPIPDLIVSNVDVIEIGALSGDTVNVINTIRNNAVGGVTADAGAFTIGVYLSDDNIIDPAADTLLTTRDVAGGLIAGAEDTATTAVTIPAVPDQKRYYIGIYADDGSAVPIVESNETNNTGSDYISIGLPATDPNALPDLAITRVALDQPTQDVVRNTNISVITEVTNVLPKDVTTAFNVGIYISRDPIITASDLLLGQRVVSSLAGYQPDSLATSVFLQEEDTQIVNWITNSNVVVEADNTIRPLASVWQARAFSSQSFPEDGRINFTSKENNSFKFAGLNDVNTTNDYVEMEYAVYLAYIRSNPRAYVYEDGVLKKNMGLFNAGDVIQIDRTNNVVRYRVNNIVKHTTINAITAPLFFDTAFGQRDVSTAPVSISDATITRVLIGTGTHYLGAIADINNTVNEVDENNNAGVQSDSVTGVAIGTTVSVVIGSNKGGGALNLVSLLTLLALFMLSLTVGRKLIKPASGKK